MVKKKIDPRIRTLIENGVNQRQRSLFVLIGDQGKEQVQNLHYILSKSQVAKRPNVLWCYKKDLGFSSHRQARLKQLKKKKQLGLTDDKEEDPFELFLTSTEIRYTYYSETDKILGNTFGMCVLQDFEALTPNLLARTIETVQGGGIVVLLLKTLTSLKQLYTMVMDVHSRYRTETSHDAVGRFNERFLLSLTKCDTCLILDDQLNVLPITASSREITPVEKESAEAKSAQEVALEALKQQILADTDDKKGKTGKSLIGLTKTLDQGKTLQAFLQVLGDHKTAQRTTVSLTAARGRGKSASLGLALAAAVANGY
jgi:N-acetyltransferase 10